MVTVRNAEIPFPDHFLSDLKQGTTLLIWDDNFQLAVYEKQKFITRCTETSLLVFQGAEYEVLDDSQEHWWKVKDEHGYVILSETDRKYLKSPRWKPKYRLNFLTASRCASASTSITEAHGTYLEIERF